MKKHHAAVLLALSVAGAQAQSVWPEALGGAALGAGLGAIIGSSTGGGCWNSHHNNGNAGQGAAIGAGVGLVAGALFGLAQRDQYYNSQPAAWAYTPTPVVGYGYAPAYAPVPVQYVPAPAPPRPNYAVGGTLLGAASGALIGQGVSGKPGVGAAIGAVSGLVVGSVAEVAARNNPPTPTLVARTPTPVAAQTMSPARQQAPIYYASARPQPQIPDAPRVPDAPSF